MKLNFLFTITHKAYELENKRIAEYYDTYRFRNKQ